MSGSLSSVVDAFGDIILGIYYRDGLETSEGMKEFLEEVMQRNNLTKRELYPHLRQALTRKDRTPALETVMSVMMYNTSMVVARLGFWSVILKQAEQTPEEELEVRFGFNPYTLR